MATEIEGRIVLDLGLVEGVSKAGNNWRKHEWVLETQGMYPRRIHFSVWGDKNESMNFEINQAYIISVDIESREYNGRWYTDVKAYSARPQGAEAQQPMQQGGGAPIPPAPQGPSFGGQSGPSFGTPAQPDSFGASDNTDDLPF